MKTRCGPSHLTVFGVALFLSGTGCTSHTIAKHYDYNKELGEMAANGEVSLNGRVKYPQLIRITPDMTVLDVIKTGGGFESSAAPSDVKVTRFNKDNPVEIFYVDASTPELKEKKSGETFQLRAGDIVYVPPSRWRRLLGQ